MKTVILEELDGFKAGDLVSNLYGKFFLRVVRVEADYLEDGDFGCAPRGVGKPGEVWRQNVVLKTAYTENGKPNNGRNEWETAPQNLQHAEVKLRDLLKGLEEEKKRLTDILAVNHQGNR